MPPLIDSCAMLTELARRHLENKEQSEALQVATELQSLCHESLNSSGEIKAFILLSEIHLLSSDARKAITCLQGAVSMSRRIGNADFEITALESLASLYQTVNDVDHAHEALGALRTLWKLRGNIAGEMHVLKSLANLHVICDEKGKAKRALDEARRLCQDSADTNGEVEICMTIADLDHAAGEYEEAVKAIKAARIVHLRTGDKIGEAEALRMVAHLQVQNGEKMQAISTIREAQSICHDQGELDSELMFVNWLCTLLVEEGDVAECERVTQQVRKSRQASGDKDGELAMLRVMMNSSLMRCDTNKAHDLGKEMCQLCRKAADVVGELHALRDLVHMHLQHDEHDQALSAAMESWKALWNQSCKEGWVVAFMGQLVFETYARCGDAHSAKDALHQTEMFLETRGDRKALGDTLLRAACVHNYVEGISEALPVADRARAAFQACEDIDGESSVLCTVAHFHMQAGQFACAAEKFHEAASCRRRFENVADQAAILQTAAYALLAAGAVNEAREFASEAVEGYRQAGSHHRLGVALRTLAKACLHAAHAGCTGRAEPQIRNILLTKRGGDLFCMYVTVEHLREAVNASTEAVMLLRLLSQSCDEEYKTDLAEALNIAALVLLWDDDSAQALQVASDAKALFGELGNVMGRASAELSIARAHFSQEELGAARVAATAACSLARECRDRECVRLALEVLDCIDKLESTSED